MRSKGETAALVIPLDQAVNRLRLGRFRRFDAPGVETTTPSPKSIRVGSNRVPLVAHIIHRLDIGGMENGVVNLINGTPNDRYRHAVICLENYTEFRSRIRRDDVRVFALDKREGKDFAIYVKVWRLLRRLRPDIVHTRNLPAVDMVVPAALAGVRHIVHGEHGRDMVEIAGDNRKYTLIRRALESFVDRYVVVSREIESWLCGEIGVPDRKIVQIYNGVDSTLFHPPESGRAPLSVSEFAPPEAIVIGTVGRMEAVKDPLSLAQAFIQLLGGFPQSRSRLRLVIVGDGTLRSAVAMLLEKAGGRDLVWLAGARDDVPRLLHGLDIFVLPSLNEGISNTILEAMASGLPVVATRVGGNPELVVDGVTGTLVPAENPAAMADALATYMADPALIRRHGNAGRERVEREFSLGRMVERYLAVYDDLLST